MNSSHHERFPEEPPPPAEVGPSLQGPPPVLRPLPRFHVWITVLLSLLIAIAFGGVIVMTSLENPVASLNAPVKSAVRVFERDLDFESVLASATPWQAAAYRWMGSYLGDTRTDAIDAYRELLAFQEGESARSEELSDLRARLVILLAEEGRWKEMELELRTMEQAAGSTAGAEAAFVAAVRFAYRERAAGEAPTGGFKIDLPSEGWAADRLQARIAGKTGDLRGEKAAADRLHERENRSRRGRFELVLVFLSVLGAGWLVWLAWLLKGCPDPRLSTAASPGPWSSRDGYAVLVRSFSASLAIMIACGGAMAVGGFAWEVPWVTLLVSLPMVWLVSRYLLRPRFLKFKEVFGLVVPPKRWSALLAFTLVLSAIDQTGCLLIMETCERLGVRANWSEFVAGGEELIWGSAAAALLLSIDNCVWAPLFEELGFRGLLYPTLRLRFRPFIAAAASGVFFSLLHCYSFEGFVEVAWGGFLWAMAYEKSRSLWPGILSHAFNNLMLCASTVLLYR